MRRHRAVIVAAGNRATSPSTASASAVVSAGVALAPSVATTSSTNVNPLTASSAGVAHNVTASTPDNQALWSELYGPAPTDHFLEVTQRVLLDIDATCQGLHIHGNGELVFDPNASRLLQVDAHSLSVLDGGHLHMEPSSPSIVHEIRFINIDETTFTAGGDNHADIDHHLNPGFMVENATVTLKGAAKTGWTRATHSIALGATTCTVADASGWQIGDEIVIIPSETGSTGSQFERFDRRTLTGVSGNVLTFAATSFAHPTNTDPVTSEVIGTEVLNLTRNVKIHGQDATHRAHIMFMSNCRGSTLDYWSSRFMGPRQVIPTATQFTNGVLGRYGIHFHKMYDGSRGITLNGVSCYDNGYRAFVPHGSHGLTFYDCVAWDVFSEGYWWDVSNQDPLTDETNDLLYDHCFAGRIRFSRQNPEGVHNSGFYLSAGQNMTIRNCCSAGIRGYIDSAGYHWPEALNGNDHNVWIFHDNDAHNNNNHGIFIWQNDGNDHNVVRFRGWNCGNSGVNFGAYFNAYQFDDVKVWNNNIRDMMVTVQTRDAGRFIEIFGGGHIEHLVIEHHISTIATPERPVRFTDVDITRITVEEGNVLANANAGYEDYINCGLHPDDVTVVLMATDSIMRIQTGGEAWSVTAPDGFTKTVAEIPLFARPAEEALGDGAAHQPTITTA